MVKRDSGSTAGTQGEPFEVTGGALCLDLANTIEKRPTAAAKELLRSYDDLVSWGEQAGAISPAEARRLAAAGRRRPGAAAAVLRRARTLREALFRIFSALARGERPPPADLGTLNEELGRALARARIVSGEGEGPLARRAQQAQYRWGWEGAGEELERVLWPVARSAGELLTGDRLSRVRECDARNCAWLFLDTSRNRSRRWCDMSVCGNREKAQRHYRRARKSR